MVWHDAENIVDALRYARSATAPVVNFRTLPHGRAGAPGWHETGPMLQSTINREAWDSLPADLQEIVRSLCQAINTDIMAEYTWGNAVALEQIKADPNVELRPLPDDVLRLLKTLSEQVLEEMAAEDEWARRIKASFDDFQRLSVANHEITELAYLKARQL